MADTKRLRLLAQSPEDVDILSAAVQDSVMKAEGLVYSAQKRRFSLELNRFRWEIAGQKREGMSRVRSLLSFDSVLEVKTRGISKADPDLVLSLLSLGFVPDSEPPGGEITLIFAGDGEIKLSVEALDATLLDSDYEWGTRHQPDHKRRRKRWLGF